MNENQITNELKLNNRNLLTLSGIKNVLKFDKNEFILDSTLGLITVTGNNMELLNLDTQNMNVKIKGLINGIQYSEKVKKQESFISKLFK